MAETVATGDGAIADMDGDIDGDKAAPAMASPAAATAAPRSRAARVFASAVDIALVPMLFLVAAGPFGGRDWLLDFTNFFKPHIAGLAVIYLVVAILARSRARLAAAALILVAALYPLLVSSLPVAASASAGNFRLMTTNVNGRNRDHEALVRLVAETGPDIVVAQEVSWAWQPTFSALEGLPHTSLGVPGTTVVVASRYPIKASRVPLTLAGMPNGFTGGGAPLRVEIERPGAVRPLVLYAVHAPTIRNWQGWTVRQRYLREIREFVARDARTADVIVAGDWNTPFWSPRLRGFLGTDGRLRTTERGAWPPPTRFFREFRLPPALGTPIDRVVVSSRIKSAGVAIGPDIGSDHLPVIADLALP